MQELKRTSTFLQKPQRPIPKPKCEQKVEEDDGESYKVIIKKQDKKTVIARLVEKGLLPPGSEASIAGTPEPPEPSEVKMHETKNQLEEDRPPVMSDLNPSCSISSLDTIDDPLLSSCSPQLNSNETRPSEDLGCPATHQCKSKLFDVKPNHNRRYSSVDGYNEARKKSLFKGHYLENILCDYARSCVSRDRQIDDQFELAKMKSGSCYFKKCWPGSIGFDCLANETISGRRMSRCPRAHYAEKILLRNVSAITRHFRSKPKTSRIVASRIKRIRTKGRYLTTYLRRESTRLISLMTTLFQFLLQGLTVSESSNIEIRKRRLSFKGCYFKHLFQKNVIAVLQRVKKTHSIGDYPNIIKKKKDEPKSTRIKGRYVEKYLHRQTLYMKSALANLLGSAKSSFDNFFSITSSSRMKSAMRGRYFERFVRRNLEILELFTEYVYLKTSEWLKESPSCISQNEFSVMTSNYITDDSILNKQRSDEDVCGIKISGWHEDGPLCSLQEESTVIVTSDNPEPNKEKIGKIDVLEYNDNSILPEEIDELSISSKIPEKEDTLSKFLQSTENYISTEVFHRGSRRLSRSRKSVDIISERDDNTFSEFLQSAENYVSAEVFHRRSRRLSRSSKNVERETGVLSNLFNSTGDYVSSEVFHRGSRRLSKSSRRESLITPDSDNMYFNLPWFSLKVTDQSVESRGNYKEKIDAEIERDNRRLSFVPTVLYQSITNRIGVDFTRLVAYAFVPCTSIILLYMYR